MSIGKILSITLPLQTHLTASVVSKVVKIATLAYL